MDDLLKILANLRADLELNNSNKRSISSLRKKGQGKGKLGKSISELEKENLKIISRYKDSFNLLENRLKEFEDWTLLSNGTMVRFFDDHVLHYSSSNINDIFYINNLFEKDLLSDYSREI